MNTKIFFTKAGNENMYLRFLYVMTLAPIKIVQKPKNDPLILSFVKDVYVVCRKTKNSSRYAVHFKR